MWINRNVGPIEYNGKLIADRLEYRMTGGGEGRKMGLTLVASTFVFHVAFASSGSAKLIPKVSDYTAVAKRGIVFRMKL